MGHVKKCYCLLRKQVRADGNESLLMHWIPRQVARGYNLVGSRWKDGSEIKSESCLGGAGCRNGPGHVTDL
jgi:hypothetical protein